MRFILLFMLFFISGNAQTEHEKGNQSITSTDVLIANWHQSIIRNLNENEDINTLEAKAAFEYLINHPDEDQLRCSSLKVLINKFDFETSTIKIIEFNSIHENIFYVYSISNNRNTLSKFEIKNETWTEVIEKKVEHISMGLILEKCNEKFSELMAETIITDIKDFNFTASYRPTICDKQVATLNQLLE